MIPFDFLLLCFGGRLSQIILEPQRKDRNTQHKKNMSLRRKSAVFAKCFIFIKKLFQVRKMEIIRFYPHWDQKQTNKQAISLRVVALEFGFLHFVHSEKQQKEFATEQLNFYSHSLPSSRACLSLSLSLSLSLAYSLTPPEQFRNFIYVVQV